VPSTTLESTTWEAERAELQSVLQSPVFARSPALSRLLSYVCEKAFSGETEQIKEYSVALDVFERRDSFDQDTDSIVRVQANRLRKRLGEYYTGEGAGHAIHITVPVGQYAPVFQRVTPEQKGGSLIPEILTGDSQRSWWIRLPTNVWFIGAIVLAMAAMIVAPLLVRKRPQIAGIKQSDVRQPAEPAIGLPVGDEVHILAGASRKYLDHSGKLWNPDIYFSGGKAVASASQHIWRTQDPIIYRSSRQGDFAYDIPLKPGTYELHLHFAETFYGPENAGGGGEASRTMTISANGTILLRDFDVLADAGGERTAEVKVFPDIAPASDGLLHLSFTSGPRGSAMVSAIEILPGARGQLRPVRVVARDVPYYSDDSRWWSPDSYFKGGQTSANPEPAEGTDDPEFYESERWGHFSYAIPVAPGRYTVTFHFIEHHATTRNTVSVDGADRVFNVFCNGRTILPKLNILKEVGENRPLVRKVRNLEPNAQGKLLLEFVPITRYATVSAIEVVPE